MKKYKNFALASTDLFLLLRHNPNVPIIVTTEWLKHYAKTLLIVKHFLPMGALWSARDESILHL